MACKINKWRKKTKQKIKLGSLSKKRLTSSPGSFRITMWRRYESSLPLPYWNIKTAFMTWIVFFLVSGVTDNTAQKIIISSRTDWLPLIWLKRITWSFSVSHTWWNLFFSHRYATSNKVDHRDPRITTAYWKPNYKDLYGNLS